MMEPRPIPRHRDILQVWWYCLDCLEKRSSEVSMLQHWIATHGEPGDRPIAGDDYVRGSQLVLMQIRRDEWIEKQAELFYKEMYEGFTAEDFVAEAEIRDA